MGYTARDLQREGKKILDQADVAPVVIRRGDVFYQVIRMNVQLGENTAQISGNVYTPVEQPDEAEFVPDSQEWSTQLQAMMDSGIIKKGL